MEKATYIVTMTVVLALGVTLASSASIGSILAVSYPAGNSSSSLGGNMTKAAGAAGANMTKAGNMTAGNMTKAVGKASNSSNPVSKILAPLINPLKKALKIP